MTLSEAKGKVLKALPDAWYCDCGCRQVIYKGEPISKGVDEADAWEGALHHWRIRPLIDNNDADKARK